MKQTNDILLVHKPSGISSFDCIRQLRRVLPEQKIGHAGTLDPRADGLMILGIGKGTKKLTELTKLDKTYRAVIRLGIATDTSDLDGEVLERSRAVAIDTSSIISALDSLVGIHEYKVSPYSAIKRGGKPLYAYMREGKEPPVVVRSMEVYRYELEGIEEGEETTDVVVSFDVASGVYIRSLAVAVGKCLKKPAVLAALTRTRIGPYDLSDATPLSLLTKKTQ